MGRKALGKGLEAGPNFLLGQGGVGGPLPSSSNQNKSRFSQNTPVFRPKPLPQPQGV